jgi:hypothetical protein
MKTSLPKLFLLTTTLLAITTPSMAAVLATEVSGQKLEKVVLSKSATATAKDKTINLTSVGAGLRAKKVVFVNVKVYVGELFVADLAKINKTEDAALDSVAAQPAAAFQLHFLRKVDAETVLKSFKESFTMNSINVEDASIKQLLEAVKNGGAAEEGKTLTLFALKNADNTESVTYEGSNGKSTTITGPTGFMKNVFSLWLGKPSDDGVADLKKSILKN